MKFTHIQEQFFLPIVHPDTELRMVPIRTVETALGEQVSKGHLVVIDHEVSEIEHECTAFLSSPTLVGPFMK